MSYVRTEKEARAIFNQWKGPVYTFSRLFLGDEERADNVTLIAFLAYFRRDAAEESDRLPTPLLRTLLSAIKEQCPSPLSATTEPKGMVQALLALPCEERAVFILRTVLKLDVETVTEATGLSRERVRALWMRSMMNLRDDLAEAN